MKESTRLQPNITVILLAIFLLLLIPLSACSSSAREDKAFFSQLKDASGHFAYPGLPFGSTPEETEKILGISLGKGSDREGGAYSNPELTMTYYFPEEPISQIYGVDARCDLQFINGKLSAVTWGFDTNREEDVKEALAALKEACGEPYFSYANEPEAGKKPQRSVEGNRWVVQEEKYFTSLTCSAATNHTLLEQPEKERRTGAYSLTLGIVYNEWTDVDGNPK